MKIHIVLLLILTLAACSIGTQRMSLESPDGVLESIVEIGGVSSERPYVLFFSFVKAGKRLDVVNSGASNVQKWACSWIDNNTFVMYSSDIGIRAWQVNSDKVNLIENTQEIIRGAELAYRDKYKKNPPHERNIHN